jgi:hypothetical protein
LSTREGVRSRLTSALAAYEAANGRLMGIQSPQRRAAFIEQLVDSVRRIEFVRQIASRPIAVAREQPHSPLFDPIRAALLRGLSGDIDEACWLIFLAIHCGRHRSEGWRLVRTLYAGDGAGQEWTWALVNSDTQHFRQWLETKYNQWWTLGVLPKFGNHRKYESLGGLNQKGTGAVVESYVAWIEGAGNHSALVEGALDEAEGDSSKAFDALYHSMSAVHRFGRLAKFDYLCMLGKCGLADVEPGNPYIDEATGPRNGARALFGLNPRALNAASTELANALGVGMQVIEDAMCNWVKQPDAYKAFRG